MQFSFVSDRASDGTTTKGSLELYSLTFHNGQEKHNCNGKEWNEY